METNKNRVGREGGDYVGVGITVNRVAALRLRWAMTQISPPPITTMRMTITTAATHDLLLCTAWFVLSAKLCAGVGAGAALGATPAVSAALPCAGPVALEGGGGACGGWGGAVVEAGPPAGATAGLMVEFILANFGKRDGLTGPAIIVAWWHQIDGVSMMAGFQMGCAKTNSNIFCFASQMT